MTLYLRSDNNEYSKHVLMYIKHHIRTLFALGIRFNIQLFNTKRIKKEQKKLKQNGINNFPCAQIGSKNIPGVDNILRFLESISIQYANHQNQQYANQSNMNQQYNEGYPKIKRAEECNTMAEYADMLNNPDYFKQFMTNDGKDEDESNENALKQEVNARAAKMEEHRKLRSSPKGMAQAMDSEIEQIQNQISGTGARSERQANRNANEKNRKAKTTAQTYDKMTGGSTDMMNSYDKNMANSSDQNGAQLVEDWVSNIINMTD